MDERQEFRATPADGTSALSAARSIVYGILARTFDSESDESLVELSKSPDVQAAFEALCGTEGTAFLECLPSLEGSDYAALYIGPGPALASPCESSYLSNDGLPMGATTLEVRKAYGKLGCAAARKNHVPDDHVSTELAFMAKASLEEGALAVQAAFLAEHLGKWARPFAERTAKARPESGYALAARTMAEFVERDARLVDEMMEDDRKR